jgi:hypothetical protein
MRTETYPLAIPEELLREIRKTAKQTGLSMADAMRQAMKLGLPRLKAELSGQNLKPLTPEEIRNVYGPDPEWDALTAAAVKASAFPKEEQE